MDCKGHCKIFLKIQGIQELPREGVELDCREKSFDLKVKGLGGDNFRLKKMVCAQINPDQCDYQIK